jgi:putative ABC transport system permease protein
LGVLKDFHYMPLSEPIKSFLFRYDPKQFAYANVKIVSKDIHATLSALESTWKKINGNEKFDAQFFDDEIKDAYSFYFSMIKICGFMGFLAVSISCLGLLGMVVYTVETRTKEVGVRKVMGASSANIAVLLSRDYFKLMLIAAMIAIPITYVFFDKAFISVQYYKFDIGVLEIIVSLALMLMLGLVTILSQTMKAAKANPVDILRSE